MKGDFESFEAPDTRVDHNFGCIKFSLLTPILHNFVDSYEALHAEKHIG